MQVIQSCRLIVTQPISNLWAGEPFIYDLLKVESARIGAVLPFQPSDYILAAELQVTTVIFSLDLLLPGSP
jgi:hypothetical protein